MGDTFQKVVDRDVAEEDTEGLADLVLRFLIEHGIVAPEVDDCVLGGKGHRPGPRADNAVEPHVHDDRCRDLPHLDWKDLAVNGVEVVTGRTVFWGDGGSNVICPGCSYRFGARLEDGKWVEEPLPRWDDAVDEWYAGAGPGLLTCPKCGYVESVTEWTYEPPWAFGHLGFAFWNWPPLRETFVEELRALLGGHRVVVVPGKV